MGLAGLIVLALIPTVALAGLILLLWALRGRLVSTHAHCRRCRFDLEGLSLSNDDARCPECGAELSRPRAVLPELRKRRAGFAALGVAMLLVPGALVGLNTYAAGRPNIHAYKPDFWLMLEVSRGNTAVMGGQLQELLNRLQSGNLNKATEAALVERALEVQADTQATWLPAWGDIIETARLSGKLTAEQRTAYMRHAPVWTMKLRPQIEAGDDWVIELALKNGRVGTGNSGLILQPVLKELRVNGEPVQTSYRGAAMLSIDATGASAVTGRTKIAGIVPGTHAITATWALDVKTSGQAEPEVARWEEDRTAQLSVLPVGSGRVQLIPNEAARADVLRAMRLTSVLETDEHAAGDDPPTITLAYGLACSVAPADLAFDIIVREHNGDGREWNIGMLAIPKGGSTNYGGGMVAEGFDATAADVILRPSINAAKGTLDVFSVWDGEVVFRNVPVVKHDPSTPRIPPKQGDLPPAE